MHNNPVCLARYARKLHKTIANQVCEACVSSDLNNISFLFSNNFYLNIQFEKAHTLLLNPDFQNFPQRNVLQQFKSVVGLKVAAVHSYFPDRSFGLEFSHNKQLYIRAYGRNSGILLVDKEVITDFFKYKQSPENWAKPDENVVFTKDKNDFAKSNPFVNSEMLEALELQHFFDLEVEKMPAIWKAFIQDLDNRPIRLIQDSDDEIRMSLFGDEIDVKLYEDDFQAQYDFAKIFLSKTRYSDTFQQLHQALIKKRKQAQKTFNNALVRRDKMTKAATFSQTADVIMANLHQLKTGTTEVELFNFYTNKTEVFKLKKDLNAQQNAARLYKKSKNAHLEESHVAKLIEQFQKELDTIDEKLETLAGLDDTKSLLNFQKSLGIKLVAETAQKALPYREFVFDSFKIWVGKSAQANDELLKLAGKYDTWLHAREVSGSHVLIRNADQKKIPTSVLEYAASLAAGHSKNQHESLAAVIHTSVKYVRKFKGGHAGQVRVDREEVILVEPKKS